MLSLQIANFYQIDLIQLSPDDWDATERRFVQPPSLYFSPTRRSSANLYVIIGARCDQVEQG